MVCLHTSFPCPQLLLAACGAGARLDAQLALVTVMAVEAGEEAQVPPELREQYGMDEVEPWIDGLVGWVGGWVAGWERRAHGMVRERGAPHPLPRPALVPGAAAPLLLLGAVPLLG